MKVRNLFLILLSVLVPQASFATTTLTVHHHSYQIRIPQNWVRLLPSEENIVLQGPGPNGTHAVVFVSHTGQTGVEFNQTALEADVGTYYEGRKTYIAQKNGKLIGLIPFWTDKKARAFSFGTGVDYQIGDEIYHERTRFTSCKGSVFQIKSLDFSSPEKAGSAFQLGKSFVCEN